MDFHNEKNFCGLEKVCADCCYKNTPGEMELSVCGVNATIISFMHLLNLSLSFCSSFQVR